MTPDARWPRFVAIRQPGFVMRQPGFVMRQPGLVMRQPGLVMRQLGLIIRQPGFVATPGKVCILTSQTRVYESRNCRTTFIQTESSTHSEPQDNTPRRTASASLTLT